MTTPTVRVADVDLPFIEYQGDPVVTFAMIDAAHQRPARTSRRNFDTNRKHFIEGDDFYRLDSEGLHEIRVSYPDLFPAAASSVTLFTETGYLMLVKSFTDDLAWQVQRQLVRSYFREREARRRQGLADTPSTRPPHPEPIDHEQRQQLKDAIDAVFGRGWMKHRSGYARAYNLMRVRFSLKRIEDLPADRFDEAMAMVDTMAQQVDDFFRLEHDLQQSFYAEVIGRGEPFTAWLSRQAGGDHRVPDRPDWKAIASQILAHQGMMPVSG